MSTPMRAAIAVASLLAALALAACGGAAEPTAQPAPTTVGVGSTPTPLPDGAAPAPTAVKEERQYGGAYNFQTTSPRVGQDPIYTNATGYFYNYGQALSSLLRYKMTMDTPVESYILSPDLVKSWEQPEPTVYILHLDPDARWQNIPPVNGRRFVASDAVFSINRLREQGSAHRSYWLSLESVEALDDDTVRLTLEAPSPDFLMLVAYGFNKMMAPESVEAGGGNLRNGPTIGTAGWYVTCEVDIQCVYKRNPEHHVFDEYGNRVPFLDEMRNLIIDDVQARFAAFRSKQLHVQGLTPEQRTIVERSLPHIAIQEGKSYGAQMIHFRTDKAPWSDPRVRQAVSVAIDRQEIIDTLLGGRGHFSSLSMVMPNSESYLPYSEFQAAYKQDTPRCRQLLQDAGYGAGISASFWVANYSEVYVSVSELIQSQMAQCGINIDLYIHDRPTYISRAFIRHGEFPDMSYGPQGTYFADAWLLLYYHSQGSKNTSYVNDPVLDRMIDEQHVELDVAKRTAILLDLQRYLLQQNYQLVVYQAISQTAYWPWVKNTVKSAGSDYPGTRAEDYFWIDKTEYAKYN